MVSQAMCGVVARCELRDIEGDIGEVGKANEYTSRVSS